MSNISNLVPISLRSGTPERNFASAKKPDEYKKQNRMQKYSQIDHAGRNNLDDSIELLSRSKENLLRALQSLVRADLKRIARHESAKAPIAERLTSLYIKLEEQYETLLLRQTHQGYERRLTLGKLSIVCRLLGKTAEANHVEEQCITAGYSALGTAGFWSLIGY